MCVLLYCRSIFYTRLFDVGILDAEPMHPSQMPPRNYIEEAVPECLHVIGQMLDSNSTLLKITILQKLACWNNSACIRQKL